MPKYDIKRGAAIIASVIAEGNQNVEAMGVNDVTMKFTLIEPVVFQLGDYCTVYGNTYIVYRKPEYTKINERQHEYDLYLVHEFYRLQNSLLKGVDKNAQLNENEFPLIGNLQMFANLVILNANRNDSGWTLGTVDETEVKRMEFDGENILASLNRIAAEFGTEFWINGKTISFTKQLVNSGITLGYGENKGLISLKKGNKDSNATIFTRLFVEGAERNLPSYTNYGFKRLQLPSANNGKVDNASAIAAFGVIEHYAKFDDIYPKHTGTITSVGDEFTFYDANLPFDVNAQLLPGVTAYVTFQSGNLAGYNFDIESFDNATKKFTILENEDEKAATLPNSTLKPAVGDTYIIFDIQMPQSHITAAENELLTRANELLAQGSDIDFNDAFTGVCDPLYFKRNTITPVLGQYVRLYETNPVIDVTKRMSKISRDLQNEWKYDITFTDKIQVNTVVREYIKNIEETLVINETVDRTIINRDAVRRAAQRIDILRGDIFDPDGYFDGTHLKPQTIEAIMATFGYKSGNFALEGVAITLNAGGVSNNFNITAGKLIHFSYDVSGAYVWDMGSMTSAFTDSAQGYYIYAKISKTALTGSWVVNNTKLQVDNEAGYYTLLIGRVYPVVNGKREIDLLYGVTNIVGNRIQTGIIQDLVGNNYWNLDTGQMRITGSVTIVGTDSNVYTKNETNAKVNVKNTNHITQPTNYIAGDTWTLQADLLLNGIQYKAGDVLTTLTSSTSFVSAHWDKRVRYVGSDDIKIGSTNLLRDTETVWGYGSFMSIPTKEALQGYVGQDMVFSFDLYPLASVNDIIVYPYQSSGISIEYYDFLQGLQANTWKRHSIKTKVKDFGQIPGLTDGEIGFYSTGGNLFAIKNRQIVIGNIEVPFELNPLDLQEKFAKLITLSGATQIIKVDKNGNKTPASQFTVTGTAQNTTITTWEYNVDGGGFGTGLPTGVTRSGNDVTIDPAAVTFKTLSIRASDGTYSDTFTVARAVDGQDGAVATPKGSVATYANLPTSGLSAGDGYLTEDTGKLYIYNGTSFPAEASGVPYRGEPGDSGYTILLSNESHTFAGSETAALAGSTTCDVITYKGDSSIAHTISIGTLPTGLTATVSGSTITFTASTSLTTNGTVDITINADGKTFVRKFSFAISFKGVQGKSVTSVDIEFSKTNSATVAPAGGWNTIAPAWEQGYWIWQRTKTSYSDGTSTYSPANNPMGQIGQTGADGTAGADGTDGRGIASMTEQYYLSTSKTTQTGGAWVDNTAPTWEQGKYLWSRLKIVYTNPTETVYTEPLVSDEWEAVNELQFSDVNLMPNSKGVFTGSSVPSFANTFKPGDKLTLGATGRLNGSVFLYVGGGTGWAGVPGLTFPESEFTYKEVTTIVPATDGSGAAWGANFTPYINVLAGADGNSQIKEIKLVKGNRTSKTWSPAPEDIQNELASFASDGILKPVEKSGLKTTMDDIAKAHAALLTRAANYPSVSTTLLASNYSTLTSYINPLLASMTTDSTIVRTTFDSYFSNYFTQRKTVEENIETANKANTDAKITFFTGGAPSWGTYKINDLWRPSATQNIDGVQFLAGEVYRCVSVASVVFGQNWKVDKSISSGTTLPSANTAKVNDLFIHEGDGNKVYQFTGTSWVVKADTRIQTAINDAEEAKVIANNKPNTFTTLPTSGGYKIGDLLTLFQDVTYGGVTFRHDRVYKANTTSPTFFNAEHWVMLSEMVSSEQLQAGSLSPVLRDWNIKSQTLVSDGAAPEGPVVLRMSNSTQPNAGQVFAVNPAQKIKTRFWARKSSDNNGLLYFCLRQFKDRGITPCDTNSGRSPYYPSGISLTTTWTLYERVWYDSDWQSQVAFVQPEFLGNYGGSSGYIEINGFTVYEVGDNAQYDSIRQVLRDDGQDIGALSLKGIFAARDNTSQVKAYMSGYGNTLLSSYNPIAFAAGVSNFGLVNESQQVAIYHNGNIIIRNATEEVLKFLANTGLLEVKGTVRADAGYFGGFDIVGNKIVNKATNTAVEFNGLDGGASFIRLNQNNTGPMVDIRTDVASRRGLNIQTYAAGAEGISVIANAGSSRALNTAGGHRLYQRSGEEWNTPGMLGAIYFRYMGTYIEEVPGMKWSITPVTLTVTVSDSSNQIIQLNHGLGHTDYMIMPVTESGNSNANVNVNKQANYCTIDMDGMTSGFRMGFMLIGRNML